MDTADFCPILTTKLPTTVDSLDYNMDHKYRGICLIINNENFQNRGLTANLVKRLGSRVDADNCTAIFRKLGFQVYERLDMTVSAVRETLKQIALMDHTDMDCFACVVLTHGDHGNLYASDGRYAIEHLLNQFLGDRCPSLIGKPKLFFIQACQGSRLDRGVSVVSTDALDAAHYFKIPTHADFLIAYSTLPGFYSFRNTERGSWFICALVQVMDEYHLSFDLLTMMTLVSHKVAYYFSSNSASPAQSGMKQVPCITSMLTRRIFLNPKVHL